ncbi:AraC family transcriptional regulator [Rubellicoccus peritrichatus]|uniref:AraC family transcriptional regulator n=1 Tax=Rubellicoccus peritrichatus TaxID=3080537 RepID=A0AAQ3QUX4_9BACT|nr:AraC family transcriptional regulator [Puniceicoccus sp. CR14]WOO40262.1 AraC family transcriptional regulator [Puniceicoccus sp. CR14]
MELKAQSVPVDPTRSRYCFFDIKDPPADKGISLALAGYEKTLPNYSIERKSFPCLGIEFVVGGQGQLDLENDKHDLEIGSVFCYGPSTYHRIVTNTEKPLEKYFIDLYGKAAEAAVKAAGLSEGSCLQRTPTSRIAPLIDGIIQDAADGVISDSILESSLNLILLLTQRTQGPQSGQSGMAYETFRKAKTYLEQHYTEPGSVIDFANNLHLDSAYLTRLFQRFANETPHRFLTRLRLSRASQLLLHHDLQIQEVAFAVGFQDAFHFSTRFRKHYGVSPKQFRQKFD